MHLGTITPAQVMPLPSGDAGVSLTIKQMRRLIDQGVRSAVVRAQALQILNGYRVAAFDWMGNARAIYEWVKQNVIFTPDPRGKEGLQSAEWTLQYRRGDCDDYTTLLCSLLGSVGMKCRIVTIAAVPDDPTQFSHVYPEVNVNGKWVTVDAARRRPAFGVAAERFYRRRVWSVDRDEWSDMTLAAANPNQLPGAFRPNQSAVWRRVRQARRRGGLAGPGLRAYRGLRFGDFEETADSISQMITAGGQATSNIISASRATPGNLFPTTGPNQRTPYGFSTGYALPSAGGFSIGTGTLLIGGLVAILALRGRG